MNPFITNEQELTGNTKIKKNNLFIVNLLKPLFPHWKKKMLKLLREHGGHALKVNWESSNEL